MYIDSKSGNNLILKFPFSRSSMGLGRGDYYMCDFLQSYNPLRSLECLFSNLLIPVFFHPIISSSYKSRPEVLPFNASSKDIKQSISPTKLLVKSLCKDARCAIILWITYKLNNYKLLVNCYNCKLTNFSEPPSKVVRELQNITVEEKTLSITLSCEFTPTPKVVRWYKDLSLIESSDRFKFMQTKNVTELMISHLIPEDSGEYRCKSSNAQTTATLTVEGKNFQLMFMK